MRESRLWSVSTRWPHLTESSILQVPTYISHVANCIIPIVKKSKFYLLKSAANLAMASTTSFPSSCPLPGIPCFFPGVALAISSSLITLYKPIWNLLATNDGPFSFHNLCQWVFSQTPHSQFRSLDVKNIRLNS